MSLYPSLEDMQMDKMITVQQQAFSNHAAQASALPAYTQNPYPELNSTPTYSPATTPTHMAVMYPNLADFMGLELSNQMIAANMPEYLNHTSNAVVAQSNALVSGNSLGNMVAPLSGGSAALQRAHVTNGVRELILCKGADNKVGLRVKDINKGVFVSIVVKDSPAALAGLRFGDQILQINGTIVAGYSIDELHKLIKKSSTNDISVVVRDRPFERAITLHKDSLGRVGFQFNNGKITSIAKESSAARNGVLIDHQLLEINAKNVIGLKDKELTKLIETGGQVITITIVPTFIYDHMMTKLATSFIRGKMDHSTPEI